MLVFNDNEDVQRWLFGTVEGREILRGSVAACKEHTLIVGYGDGQIEVYAERLRVHCVNKVWTTTPEAAQTAEDYIDATIPKVFKKLYVPGKLQAQFMVEKVTADDEIDRRLQLEVLKEIQSWKVSK